MENDVLLTKTFLMTSVFVETLKIPAGGLKSKPIIFLFPVSLDLSLVSLIFKLKTLATNKTKYIAFQVYNDL